MSKFKVGDYVAIFSTYNYGREIGSEGIIVEVIPIKSGFRYKVEKDGHLKSPCMPHSTPVIKEYPESRLGLNPASSTYLSSIIQKYNSMSNWDLYNAVLSSHIAYENTYQDCGYDDPPLPDIYEKTERGFMTQIFTERLTKIGFFES